MQNFVQAHRVEFRGFRQAGDMGRGGGVEGQKRYVEMKVRRLVNRIFRGLNRLKDVSSQNWDSIMNEFDKGWHQGFHDLVTHNKILGELLGKVQKVFD